MLDNVLKKFEKILFSRTKGDSPVTLGYPVYVNQENAYHQQKMDNIGSEYHSRGMGFSGMYQEAIAEESTRHQQKLSLLEVEYSRQLTLYDC